ncbi:protein jim lovell-like isoform X2 [Penaeus monodon]|uniref:protein jim lovell-like isoform X2 n=1 Tax=Penaeus monodon TaxID=6687 RepID=UPI0018A7D496|nr:protein jim lovell-like isoform X2 [Penaeus monodon]
MSDEGLLSWSRPHTLLFIDLLKQQPCLWKTKSKEYKNRILRNVALRSVCLEMTNRINCTVTPDIIMRKIHTLRTQFRRQVKAVEDSAKSGAGAQDLTPRLWCFDRLSFLNDGDDLGGPAASLGAAGDACGSQKPMSKKRRIDSDDSSAASTSKQDHAQKNIPLMHKRPEASSTPISTCRSLDGQPVLTPKTKNRLTPESQHSKHQTLILKGLLEDVTFADVTLTAEGKSLKAHKAVLSAMSPYFKKVLQNNPSPHPIIIMPLDMQFEDLKGIIDYIYMGEIVVPTENLSSLFKAGRVLQVSGLTTVDTIGVKAPNAPLFDNAQSVHKDTSGTTLSMETNQGCEVRLDTSRKEDANRKSRGSSVETVSQSERQKHKEEGANSTMEAVEPLDNRNQKRPETVDSSEAESFEKTSAQPLQAKGNCTAISDDDSSKCMFMTDEETMSSDFDYKYFEEQEEELDPLQIHSHGSDDSFHQSANISNGQQCDSINFVTVKEELED